jgi:hypothetical protein
VALLPVRFFSADAANLHLISLIAPAREGDTCRATTACGRWRVGTMPARVGSDPRCFVCQVAEEERRRYLVRTGPPARPGDDTDG